jgi:hypothetical protein
MLSPNLATNYLVGEYSTNYISRKIYVSYFTKGSSSCASMHIAQADKPTKFLLNGHYTMHYLGETNDCVIWAHE